MNALREANRRLELPGRQLLLHRIPDRCRRRGLRRFVLLNFLALDLPHRRAVAQSDSPRIRADLDDLEIVFLAWFQRPRALQRPSRRTEARRVIIPALALF